MTKHVWVLLGCLSAFYCFALGIERSHQVLRKKELHRRTAWAWRAAAWGMLGVSLSLSIQSLQVSFGLVAFTGHCSLAAGTLFFYVHYSAQRRARRQQLPPKTSPKSLQ